MSFCFTFNSNIGSKKRFIFVIKYSSLEIYSYVIIINQLNVDLSNLIFFDDDILCILYTYYMGSGTYVGIFSVLSEPILPL